ncbi:MAG: 2-amino-4-hydroxy-6-hydroxymethyldihydropteridine diphosphokinase [Blastopirellula sp.]|nr:MAG: 2-amino-4-hydroxy-6-hydroxymethyldihydropteridine diphosphokinase [Blastopirellula sp.]
MASCLIALGANLGLRNQTLDAAVKDLQECDEIQSIRVSRYFETAPVGGPDGQGEFSNAAARIETTLGPSQLHQLLIEIEERHGRVRIERWGERRLDLDLLLYDDIIQKTDRLEIPHPRMSFRRFVIEPACQVAGDMVHAPSGCTIPQLWDQLQHAAPVIELVSLPSPWMKQLCTTLSEENPQGVVLNNYAALQVPSQVTDFPELIQGGLIGLPDFRELLIPSSGQKAVVTPFSPLLFSWMAHKISEKMNTGSSLGSDMFLTSEYQPRLQVLWDTPYEIHLSSETREPLSEENHRLWTQELADWFYEKNHGPLLHLGNHSVEAAAVEINAALQAMV